MKIKFLSVFKFIIRPNMKHFHFFLSAADLALLSLSDHSIITYGTFGLWGSLLGKSERLTICPKDFSKTDIGKEVHQANLPNWIFL